ncbi:MAG: T9SS type A sorting domain-containing protein, partial [Bacteroidota bacterium]
PDEIWVAKLGSNYNLITGSVYADFNANGIRDTNDIGIQNKMVTESTTGRVGVTDANGHYEIPVFGAGNYTVIPPAVTNYQPIPATQSPVFANASSEIDSLNDFGYISTNPNTRDWMIRMLLWNAFRPGFAGLFSFDVYNFGSLPEAGTVTIYADTGVVFDSCNFAGAMVYPDSIVVPIPTQQPLTFRWIIVGYHVLTSVSLNTPITLVGHVEPSNGDVNTLNNTDTLFSTVTGAFDPNDITSNVDKLYNYQIAQHPELKYLIRFQNTGNDTAFNIVVVDTLSPLLNPASVKLLSSSNPVQMDYNSLYRTLKFTFPNILLVDSNHNEPLSHGAVSFSVEPNTNVYAGDVINASANIYFDYNAAVRTNDWEIPVIIPMAIQQVSAANEVTMYPNPVANVLTVKFKNDELINAITVYSIVGQEMISINQLHSSDYKLNLNTLSEGSYIIKIQTANGNISKTIFKK